MRLPTRQGGFQNRDKTYGGSTGKLLSHQELTEVIPIEF